MRIPILALVFHVTAMACRLMSNCGKISFFTFCIAIQKFRNLYRSVYHPKNDVKVIPIGSIFKRT